MNKASMQDYWDALDRLVKGDPLIVPKGGRITNDQVSIEAGRLRGSIKKSRESHIELIVAIEASEKKRLQLDNNDEKKYLRRRAEAEKYKLLYQRAIAGQISLAKEIKELKSEIHTLRSKSIRSITPKT